MSSHALERKEKSISTRDMLYNIIAKARFLAFETAPSAPHRAPKNGTFSISNRSLRFHAQTERRHSQEPKSQKQA